MTVSAATGSDVRSLPVNRTNHATRYIRHCPSKHKAENGTVTHRGRHCLRTGPSGTVPRCVSHCIIPWTKSLPKATQWWTLKQTWPTSTATPQERPRDDRSRGLHRCRQRTSVVRARFETYNLHDSTRCPRKDQFFLIVPCSRVILIKKCQTRFLIWIALREEKYYSWTSIFCCIRPVNG